MEETIYLNGNLVPHSSAHLSPFDHGFLYGYGLYETMRSYNSTIFRLDRHLERLDKSAKVLGLSPRLVHLDLEKACYDLLKANRLADARIRLTISAGAGDITPNPRTCEQPTVFIVARQVTPPPPEVYQSGYKAIISSHRRNSQSPLSQVKSTCCLENVLAIQEAKASGFDEALILNEKGMLAEGSTCNIFLVKDSTLVTPTIQSGALPGITREAVLELAQSLKIKSEEREVRPEELVQADEVFRTSSILEIMPITCLGEKLIGSGKPGPITQKIMSTYRELVRKETRPD
ncbi:MAG: aminotransferase class IV [Chloroflexi bacterium]|nr:aminotransferase class IV [Chloroflexota bacterium]